MKLLLCSLSAAGAIAVGGAAAYAADLDARPVYNPPAVYSWTGFYLGGNCGFGGDKLGPLPALGVAAARAWPSRRRKASWQRRVFAWSCRRYSGMSG
jgi:hypothetical protein